MLLQKLGLFGTCFDRYRTVVHGKNAIRNWVFFFFFLSRRILFSDDLLVVQCGCFCRYNSLCSVRSDLFHSSYSVLKYVNIKRTHCRKVREHNIC